MPDISLDFNPLEGDWEGREMLLIFDGLDEMGMQGKSAWELAGGFIDELKMLCSRINRSERRLRILITGRPIAVQHVHPKLRIGRRQILHLLPYYVQPVERPAYIDPDSMLPSDQRILWWRKFRKLKQLKEGGIPACILNKNTDELTTEPLLNMLVAISWQQEPERFNERMNLNDVYQQLIEGVYQRSYGSGTHRAMENLSKGLFFRIIEEIAVCAWHGGDVRVTSARKIERHIAGRQLEGALERYKESTKCGVSRLLTAFYFRKFGTDIHAEKLEETFEFTHKSFGEYLAARSLVELLQQTHQSLEEFKANNNYRATRGWSIPQALEAWLMMCGPVGMDADLNVFVKNELLVRKDKVDLREWQQTVCGLISSVLCNGFPFKIRATQQEEARQSRHALTALFVLLSNMANTTGQLSTIKWPSPHSFQQCLSILSASKTNQEFAFGFLNHLDLQGTDLSFADLRFANLRACNFEGVNLCGAILDGADFRESKNLNPKELKAVNSCENVQGLPA